MRASLFGLAALAALGVAGPAAAAQPGPAGGVAPIVAGAPGVTVDFAHDLGAEARPPEASRAPYWRARGLEAEILGRPHPISTIRPLTALERGVAR